MFQFVCILIISILFAVILKKPLKRFPWVFYIIALALDALLVASFTVTFPRHLQTLILFPLQRCYIALSLFAIVMFIGVFSNKSRIKAYLIPIRAELSILACILTLAHIIRHVSNYLPRLFSDTVRMILPNYMSIIIALLISALMLLLGVTSFKAIRERMSATAWKRIQRFAYPFFILIYVHLGLFLLPSTLHGGTAALENFVIYTVIFLTYSVFRIRKAFIDRHTHRHYNQDTDISKV